MFHSESDISIIEYVLLSLLSFFLSSINWHKFKRLWAISFGFYCWYMIGNLQRSALEGLFRTAWLSACWSSSRLADIILSQTWVTYSLSNWVNFIILFDIMVHPMRTSWSKWEQPWLSNPADGYWPERCLGHVCLSPKPIGSTHLSNCFFFGMSSLVFFWLCSSNGMYGCQTLLFGICARWALISNSSDFYFLIDFANINN